VISDWELARKPRESRANAGSEQRGLLVRHRTDSLRRTCSLRQLAEKLFKDSQPKSFAARWRVVGRLPTTTPKAFGVLPRIPRGPTVDNRRLVLRVCVALSFEQEEQGKSNDSCQLVSIRG
jgi:hypothetical protein